MVSARISLRGLSAVYRMRFAIVVLIAVAYLIVGYNHQHIHFDDAQATLSGQLAKGGDLPERNDEGGVQTHDHCHSCAPVLPTPFVAFGLAETEFVQAYFDLERQRSAFCSLLDPPPPRTIG